MRAGIVKLIKSYVYKTIIYIILYCTINHFEYNDTPHSTEIQKSVIFYNVNTTKVVSFIIQFWLVSFNVL